jgi:lipopolysaccharide/colanic/teichoic acid biosynthesis glycosyltransferase
MPEGSRPTAVRLTVHAAERSGPGQRVVEVGGKPLARVLDITVAVVALALAAPVLVVAALAIRLTSRGPVLFRQAVGPSPSPC